MPVSAIGSATTITVIYYCIIGKRGGRKEMSPEVGRIELKSVDPREKERSGSL
jgi:hypothetical protein